MSKLSGFMIAREDFQKKIDVLLFENKNATLIMAFIPHELILAQKLSKDDEEKLILGGWQYFSQNFPFIYYWTRRSWCTYFILLEQESSEIITTLNKLFNHNEEYLYFNLWRIAFTELKDSKERTMTMLSNFEGTGNKAALYNPHAKIFQVHVYEQLSGSAHPLDGYKIDS